MFAVAVFPAGNASPASVRIRPLTFTIFPMLMLRPGHSVDVPPLSYGDWIASAFWGQGIATEAGRALLANARHSLRLPRLVAGHFTDNPASGRVLQKLGFRPTGVVRGRYSAGRDAIAPAKEFVLKLGEAEADPACAMAACAKRSSRRPNSLGSRGCATSRAPPSRDFA